MALTRQESLDLMADELQAWLDRNEEELKKDGKPVRADSNVIPNSWPSRCVLDVWISILRGEE